MLKPPLIRLLGALTPNGQVSIIAHEQYSPKYIDPNFGFLPQKDIFTYSLALAKLGFTSFNPFFASAFVVQKYFWN